MDDANDAMLHIRRGCQLAKELQERLPYLENEPHVLSSSCVEITSAFQKAIGLLNSSMERQRMIFGGGGGESSRRPHDHILSGLSQAMDFFHPHAIMGGATQFDASRMGTLEAVPAFPAASRMADYVGGSGGGGGGGSGGSDSGDFRVGDVGDAGTSAQGAAFPAGRSSRSRKEAGEKRIVRVPAPREGNLEIPPDDGFTWRKGYFRCTHRNFYNCQAKKQVQRLDEDPFTFEVTYRGHHTCQTSTAPLGLMPTSQTQQAILITPQDSPVSTSIALSSWFSSQLEGGVGVGVERPAAAERNPPPVSESQLQTPFRGYQAMGDSSSNVVFGECSSHGGGGGNKQREASPVEEYAKFMFSSGSSSDNIDSIFSAKKED
ncbi:DNA binding domain [Asimina triloba]